MHRWRALELVVESDWSQQVARSNGASLCALENFLLVGLEVVVGVNKYCSIDLLQSCVVSRGSFEKSREAPYEFLVGLPSQ